MKYKNSNLTFAGKRHLNHFITIQLNKTHHIHGGIACRVQRMSVQWRMVMSEAFPLAMEIVSQDMNSVHNLVNSRHVIRRINDLNGSRHGHSQGQSLGIQSCFEFLQECNKVILIEKINLCLPCT